MKRTFQTTSGSATTSGFFFYDGDQMVLELDSNADVVHRLLWGPAVDQALADEIGVATIHWYLTDHLGTVRDVATYSAGTTTIANHIAFDSFGKRLSETNSSLADYDLGFTGKWLDRATGLQWNHNRWYNAGIQRWMSQDPIKDGVNWGIYVDNAPTMFVDSNGLEKSAPLGQHPLGDVGYPISIPTVVEEFEDKHGSKILRYDNGGLYSLNLQSFGTMREGAFCPENAIDVGEEPPTFWLGIDAILGGYGTFARNAGRGALAAGAAGTADDLLRQGFRTGAEAQNYLAKMLGATADDMERTIGTGITRGGATHIRRLDILIEGTAHESKMGYVCYTQKTLTQIQKDAWLLKEGRRFKRVEWHFFRSAETGRIGGDPRIFKALDDAGIKYTIH